MKILKDGQEVNSLDFGFVEIGVPHSFAYVLKNDSPYDVIDLEVAVADKNVQVTAPNKMEPHGEAELIFNWTPPIDQKKGLKTVFKIKRTEVYK